MTRVRAFVALNLPVETVEKAAVVQAELRRVAKEQSMRVGWVPAPNMHVTLKFLGPIDSENVAAIGHALGDALAQQPALPVTVRGVGAFPDRQRPRVLWAGVHGESEAGSGGPDAVGALAARVDGCLADLGFAPEKRPFHAHLTLGRVRGGATDVLEGFEERDIGECLAREVVLYESTLERQGAEYRALARFALVVPAQRRSGRG